jgi:hypothetical protein
MNTPYTQMPEWLIDPMTPLDEELAALLEKFKAKSAEVAAERSFSDEQRAALEVSVLSAAAVRVGLMTTLSAFSAFPDVPVPTLVNTTCRDIYNASVLTISNEVAAATARMMEAASATRQ